MSTPITSIVRMGRRGWAVSVPLLAAGALVAGCGTTHAGSAAAGSGATSGSAGPSSATPVAPVPTVTGGTTGAGAPNCVGWPAGAPSIALSPSFAPVTVERCVAGTAAVTGKGQWVTETLEKSSTGLTGLVNALHQRSATHTPGIMCPAFAIEPPQLVLVNGAGQKIIPTLPRTGCGQVESKVLAQLNQLHWTTVSVRLVSRLPVAPKETGGVTPGTGSVTR